MARYEEAAKLLKAGNSPTQIAHIMGVSHYSAVQYLYVAIARGMASRSDIVFSIDKGTSIYVESVIESHPIRTRWDLQSLIRREMQNVAREIDVDEAMVYFDLREAPLADMYERLCRTERFLHKYT